MHKLTHDLFLYSLCSAACFITGPLYLYHSPTILAFIFSYVIADPANPAPLQPLLPLLSPWFGDSFVVLLDLPISSHYHCVPEISQHVDNGEREREKTAQYQWYNYSTVWRQEKELEDCEHWWVERRRLCSFTHPSSQASQHLSPFFKKKKTGKTKGLRDVLERTVQTCIFSKPGALISLEIKLTLTVQLHLAMSVLKWSKHSKRSSDNIYDMLHLVRFLFLYLASFLLLLWYMMGCCGLIPVSVKYLSFAVVSRLLLAATDRQKGSCESPLCRRVAP